MELFFSDDNRYSDPHHLHEILQKEDGLSAEKHSCAGRDLTQVSKSSAESLPCPPATPGVAQVPTGSELHQTVLCQPSYHGIADSVHWIQSFSVSTVRDSFNWDPGEQNLCPCKPSFLLHSMSGFPPVPMAINFAEIRRGMHAALSCSEKSHERNGEKGLGHPTSLAEVLHPLASVAPDTGTRSSHPILASTRPVQGQPCQRQAKNVVL